MKTLIIPLLFLTQSLSAQFNTLTYRAPQETSTVINTDQQITVEPDNHSKKKTSKREQKNRALRKQTDSLKSLIEIYQKQSVFESNLLLKNLLLQMRTVPEESNDKQEESTPGKYYKTITPSATTALSMPLNGELNITSPFGERYHPILHRTKAHHGVDIRANYQEVYTVLKGTVVEAGWDSHGGGNYIKIKHSNHYETSYLHLSKLLVNTGEKVEAGDLIGISGNTGNSTGPHLHFAVKEDGRYIDPLQFLNQLINFNNTLIAYHGK